MAAAVILTKVAGSRNVLIRNGSPPGNESILELGWRHISTEDGVVYAEARLAG